MNTQLFISQFSSFTPSNDWELKFAQSLHKQVFLLKKDLSEKQVACWEKMLAPKTKIEFKDLSEDAKKFIAQSELVKSKLTDADTSTKEFVDSLTKQVFGGKTLSEKQVSVFNKILERKTKEETPKAETPKAVKAKAVKTPKAEEVKVVETPKAKATKAKATK